RPAHGRDGARTPRPEKHPPVLTSVASAHRRGDGSVERAPSPGASDRHARGGRRGGRTDTRDRAQPGTKLERNQRSADRGEAGIPTKSAGWRVEAGGIEPPSEGASPSASTSVAGDLILAALAPIGRIARGQPAKISIPAPPASRGPSPRR